MILYSKPTNQQTILTFAIFITRFCTHQFCSSDNVGQELTFSIHIQCPVLTHGFIGTILLTSTPCGNVTDNIAHFCVLVPFERNIRFQTISALLTIWSENCVSSLYIVEFYWYDWIFVIFLWEFLTYRSVFLMGIWSYFCVFYQYFCEICREFISHPWVQTWNFQKWTQKGPKTRR